MSSKLDRLEAWFDYQNARHDERGRQRASWWHAAKIVFGVLCLGKSIALATKATGIGGYALAALFVIAGLTLTIEGATILLERWLAKQA
jgi:hypothetical protein